MARDLKKGCTGSDVLELQKMLQAVGYYLDGTLDGSFGKKTDRAVREFQKASGLKVDGIYGPKTRAVLEKKVEEKKKKKKKKKRGSRTGTTAVSVEMGRWGGHKFVVSDTLIYSFKSLQIKGSSEMESSKDDKDGYVKRKAPKPTEVSFTISLNAHAGCDVRTLAAVFVESARAGKKDYFYVGDKKLTPCQLMLTDCTVKEVEINHGNQWTRADVQLTMKQCSKNEAASTDAPDPRGSSSGDTSTGSKKYSVKTDSPTTTTREEKPKKGWGVSSIQTKAKATKTKATTTKEKVKTACKAVKATQKAAKKASAKKVKLVVA